MSYRKEKTPKKKVKRNEPTVKKLLADKEKTPKRSVAKQKKTATEKLKIINLKEMLSTITPKTAVELLEANTINRPIRQKHVDRLAKQIREGLWRCNGETIKISPDFDVLDGQHRLWGVVIADKPIKTLVVLGVELEAFSTIDTIRQSRTGGDVLALSGLKHHRTYTATALSWLIRWQKDVIPEYKNSENRIENSDLEEIFLNHPNMYSAVERVTRLRGLIPPGIMGFLYYILASRDPDLADRFVNTLESPASVGVGDPFYRFRAWLIQSIENKRRRDPVLLIALALKAWNFAKTDKEVEVLSWRQQGKHPEVFPTIEDSLEENFK